eukprot:TRINITY_DN53785_c0_g1_i1.p1 TRINITY_DN53785_c0_g1~~TRINITY_DN53785_c0_g1_i1.p1  ORF type:complete len:100 (-),score=7.26 TRINITY_DN53785_c0_g1_i1:71-370(-)
MYMAPEVLKGENYSTKADIYGFAFVLYELAVRKPPFSSEMPIYEIIEKVQEGFRPTELSKTHWLYDLVQKCWDKEAAKRPTFDEIVSFLATASKKLPHS